jgi:UDP-glucose 4-epimerase
MRALVTGGAGFIGSRLVEALRCRGHATAVIGRRAEPDPSCGSYRLDILDAEALRDVFERERPDVVFHLAAQSRVRPSLNDPVNDAAVNVVGLLNVLQSAKGLAQKVVFASSGGAIYGRPTRIPIQEGDRFLSTPLSPYGISKKVAEDYLRFFRDSSGLDYTALALATVYGPRQRAEDGVIPLFVSMLFAGETPTIFGTGGETRDYVYVDDVVEAFVLAASLGSGELLNIGTGRETSLSQIFSMLAEFIGFSGEPAYCPQPQGEVSRLSLDVSRAWGRLTWQPCTALEDGLQRTVEWFRSRR